MRNILLIAFWAILGTTSATAQNEPYKLKDNINFGGYLKYMQTTTFSNASDLMTNNLIHNRLNLKWYLPARFVFDVEMRNRIIFGEITRSIPGYGKQINNYDGILPFEILWVDEGSVVISSIFDRMWFAYEGTHFYARIGRQRINWGMNPVWNPNDLFNTLNYLDFDYEERPGADAVMARIYTGELSEIELAWKWAEHDSDNVGAAKFKFNTGGYDIQFLAGKYRQDLALGSGWAGNLWQAGFKGEATYFIGYRNIEKQTGVLSLSATLDYGFKSGWYIMGSYLFNSSGTDQLADVTNIGGFILFAPSAKTLMPNKHTIFVNTSAQLSPVFSLNLGAFYGFQVNWLIFFPTVTYSIKENWDIDLIGQIFFAESRNHPFQGAGNGVFFRLKWSY